MALSVLAACYDLKPNIFMKVNNLCILHSTLFFTLLVCQSCLNEAVTHFVTKTKIYIFFCFCFIFNVSARVSSSDWQAHGSRIRNECIVSLLSILALVIRFGSRALRLCGSAALPKQCQSRAPLHAPHHPADCLCRRRNCGQSWWSSGTPAAVAEEAREPVCWLSGLMQCSVSVSDSLQLLLCLQSGGLSERVHLSLPRGVCPSVFL